MIHIHLNPSIVLCHSSSSDPTGSQAAANWGSFILTGIEFYLLDTNRYISHAMTNREGDRGCWRRCRAHSDTLSQNVIFCRMACKGEGVEIYPRMAAWAFVIRSCPTILLAWVPCMCVHPQFPCRPCTPQHSTIRICTRTG